MRHLVRLTRRQVLWLLAGTLAGCALKPTATAPVPTPKPAEPTSTASAPTPKPAEPTSTSPAPTEPPATTGRSYLLAALKAPGFAAVMPESLNIKPAVKAYKTDPRAVLNQEDVLERFTPEQLKALEEWGFVITPSDEKQIYDIYIHARSMGLPVFVTTDALLHTFHILYDYTLRRVEYDHFVADLKGLMEAMLSASEAQAKEASALKSVAEAATRNMAFFAVAGKLLDPQARVPAVVRELVDKELALIQAHEGFGRSPIFGYDEDYSQYVPRGHYTRNETFERYFRAMMWLGRMMFRLRPGERPELIGMGRRETRQALLIVAALQNAKVGDEPALAVWERIYEPTVFFVGKADDLSLYEYSEVISRTFGNQLALDALSDDARLDAFIQAARTLRPPKIVSSLVLDVENPAAVTQGFRFMGQRFVPDSYIFQQLVYDKVKGYQGQGKPFTMEPSLAGPVRAFPRGLDIAAVLGSERALEILRAEGDTEYDGYEEQMAKLRAEFAGLPPEQWTENLYWNWLHALRPVLEPKGEGYPTFMRSSAWTDKNLNTFLGSWTELRHDTILYAKQSYTIKATGLLPPPPKLPGYVEPEPEVWNRLLCLARLMRKGLGDRGLLDQEFAERLEGLENLVATLRDISLDELANRTLGEAQAKLIENIGSWLKAITTFEERTQKEITSAADERMAVVADVHTDPNSGQVLEEGVGDPLSLYVIVPGEGGTYVTVGGIFSHYEFKQPMSARLTDEAWQALEPKPPFAPWFEALVKPW